MHRFAVGDGAEEAALEQILPESGLRHRRVDQRIALPQQTAPERDAAAGRGRYRRAEFIDFKKVDMILRQRPVVVRAGGLNAEPRLGINRTDDLHPLPAEVQEFPLHEFRPLDIEPRLVSAVPELPDLLQRRVAAAPAPVDRIDRLELLPEICDETAPVGGTRIMIGRFVEEFVHQGAAARRLQLLRSGTPHLAVELPSGRIGEAVGSPMIAVAHAAARIVGGERNLIFVFLLRCQEQAVRPGRAGEIDLKRQADFAAKPVQGIARLIVEEEAFVTAVDLLHPLLRGKEAQRVETDPLRRFVVDHLLVEPFQRIGIPLCRRHASDNLVRNLSPQQKTRPAVQAIVAVRIDRNRRPLRKQYGSLELPELGKKLLFRRRRTEQEKTNTERKPFTHV